jgi:choline dehydrogenase-like flavoprotein
MLAYPSKADLDNWGKPGNKNWNFDKLGPYFKKFELFTLPSEKITNSLDTSELEPSMHASEAKATEERSMAGSCMVGC